MSNHQRSESPSRAAIAVYERFDSERSDSAESTIPTRVPDSDSSHRDEPSGSSQSAKSGSTNRWLPLGLITMSVIVVIAIGWMIRSRSISDSGPKLTHQISRGDLAVTVIEQGTLESSNNTEIKCRIRGSSTVTWVVEVGTVVQPGDELVKIDTKRLEEAIGTHSTDAYVAKAAFERTKADVARAEIAIEAYLEGTYRAELKALEKLFKLAESNLEAADKIFKHSAAMFRKGYVSKYEVESNRFAVKEAELELKIRQTEIKVLNNYTKEMELETLRGDLRSLHSKFLADKAGLLMDEGRRDRAIQELENCVIKAERSGMVIYPSAAAWKTTPDIEKGATIRNDQTLLLMPDLSKMQVKVGIHEALVDRIKKGQLAKITLPDSSIEGVVSHVASVARPAGWWTGNMVKYDIVIDLPPVDGLKPGMSAEVEVVLSEHRDEVLVPVSAVVETEKQTLCWVKTELGVSRRVLKLGESNDVFIIVKSGLTAGDEVVLNPLRYVDDAQGEAFQTLDEANPAEPNIDKPISSKTIGNTQSDQLDTATRKVVKEGDHVQ